MFWIKFNLIERPYYDPRTGCVLGSIAGRKNRFRGDPFAGGGKVYPDLSRVMVLERHEKGGMLLVLVDGDQKEIDKLKKTTSVIYNASPRKTATAIGGFQPESISEEQAKSLKKEVFGLSIKSVESGVTR